MLQHLRQVRLDPLAVRALQAAAARSQALRAYTTSLQATLEDLPGARACSTSDSSTDDCGHRQGDRAGLSGNLPPRRGATWSVVALAASAHSRGSGTLHGALAQLFRDAVRTTSAAVTALQVGGCGPWAAVGCGLLLARRLPTEPEPFEDECDDDEYEDGEYVDLDDEDLLGDLAEVGEAEEEEDWRRNAHDEEEQDDGVGEEEDDDDDDLPPLPLPPPGQGRRKTFWR